jgi:soluble lytic murein transglycosylase-like protein
VAQWRDLINDASRATGVPADLLGAVMYQESTADPSVMGTTNPGNGLTDAGLMQVNPDTQKAMMDKYPALFQGLSGAAENIMAGACYMKDQYQAFGSWDKANRAYNSGPLDPGLAAGDVNHPALGDPAYVTKVNAWWRGISSGQTLPADYDPSKIK